jgi:hypothetical protein
MWTSDDKGLGDPQRALRMGLGFASPLWPTFFAAASAGVAYWAWAQWARGRAFNEFQAPEPDLTAPPAANGATPPAERPEPGPVQAEPAAAAPVPAQAEPEAPPMPAPAVNQAAEPAAAAPEPALPKPPRAPRRKPAAPLEAARTRAVAPEPAPAPKAQPRARKPRVAGRKGQARGRRAKKD